MGGPFQSKIMIEQLECVVCERQDANLGAFAGYTDLRVADEQVIDIQCQDFTRAEAVQDHEAHDGEIARVPEAGTEAGDLFYGQWRNDAFGSPYSQLTQGWAPSSDAEWRTATIPVLQVRGRLGHGIRALRD